MSVNAICTNAETVRLNALANTLTTDFEVKRGVSDEEILTEDGGVLRLPTYDFSGKVYGLTRDLYIVVKNSVNSESRTFSFSDARDGVITFSDLDENRIINYTIEVYAARGDCVRNLLRTFSLTIPKVNELRDFLVCQNAPEHYLCREFISTDWDFDIFEAATRVNEYIERNKEAEDEEEVPDSKTFFENLFGFINEYKYFFIGGIVIITIGTITFIMFRRKRSVK